MYVAATRRSALSPTLPPNVAAFALPLEDALRHGTYDAAWSCLADQERGSLVPGKAADFTVIDRDPFVEGRDALLDARIRLTVVDGDVVHTGPAGPSAS